MAADVTSIRQAFMLDPEITYLNHGAFGACPVPVFAVYQDWQRRLEREPVQFMQAVLMPALQRARQALGGYLKAEADDLVFITDATEGVNIIARSLKLEAGDEILTSDHEYGACDNVWDFVAAQSGARVVRRPVDLPLASE
jgi:isopenicillin-N epimerase